MEQRAEYAGRPERPRLTVVRDDGGQGRYSALPHAVLFSDLSDGEVRVYATVQSYAWGNDGECTASHETIAGRIGKEIRTVRRLLKGLVDKGYLNERRVGRGQSKAYRCQEVTTGQNRPVATGQNVPVSESNRPKSATQQAKIGRFNRPNLAAPIEEDSSKKPVEEELQPTAVDGDASAPPATAAAAVDQATILRGLSDGAREILDWHRQCHGRRQPAKLNPESARVLEEAVVDLGVDRLKESVRYMAGKIPAVPELSKAIRAARTKRTQDEQGSPVQPAPHRNGSAPMPPRRDVAAAWAKVAPTMGGAAMRGGRQDKGRGDGR